MFWKWNCNNTLYKLAFQNFYVTMLVISQKKKVEELYGVR